MRDLIVVGGGPVGLATALYAARAGLDVEVREARAGVLDKACGEGLMPPAVADLAGLGVHPAGHPITGIAYLDGRRRAVARFRGAPGLGVRRTTLHAALAAAVEAAGVPVVRTRVGSVVPTAAGVDVDGTRARYAVAADGLHSPTRRALGLDRPTDPGRRRRHGLRAHLDLAPWSDLVEVHWSPDAEAYVTPVGADRVGVAVLTSTRRGFDDLVGDFPLLRERLAGHPHGRVRGAGPLRQRATHRVAGRVLLVGDAAGYVDALTGEGLALGLAQARAAVAAVRAGAPADYEVAWRRLTRRHDLLTHGLLAASGRPVVRRRLVGTAAALPRVFGAAVDQLARPA